MQFIKHILQIEAIHSIEDTVSISFDNFIKEHTTLSNNQIEFPNLLRKYMVDKGNIEKKDLINLLFTQIHQQGILGVFSSKKIEEILSVINKIAA